MSGFGPLMSSDAWFWTPLVTDLWRGMKDIVVSDEFMSYGGSELGCMSTSESLKIIASYAYSSSPLLFRMKVETPMDRGARLKWLSVYPDEDEGARDGRPSIYEVHTRHPTPLASTSRDL